MAWWEQDAAWQLALALEALDSTVPDDMVRDGNHMWETVAEDGRGLDDSLPILQRTSLVHLV